VKAGDEVLRQQNKLLSHGAESLWYIGVEGPADGVLNNVIHRWYDLRILVRVVALQTNTAWNR